MLRYINNVKLYNILIIIFLGGFLGFAFLLFKDNYHVILLCQFIIVLYMFQVLKKSSYLSIFLLLFPLLKYIYYQTFSDNWYMAGDFQLYIELLNYAFSNDSISIDRILELGSIFDHFYYLTIINMYIPKLLFDIQLATEQSYIYLYFNDLVYLVLIFIVMFLYKDIIKKSHLLYIILFLLYSPSSLAQTVYPDRHIFSLFALLIFVRGFIEFKKNHSINFLLIISLIILAINKLPLLLGIALYYIIYRYKNSSKRKRAIEAIVGLGIVFMLYVLSKDILLSYFMGRGTNVIGLASSLHSMFGSLYWFVMPPIKYIYAILSPFPWYKYDTLLVNVGGSYVALVMTYLNSVVALSIFYALVKYFKKIKKNDFFYENFILFGMVMSLTIVPSELGHYAYLSLYFVLFLPIFFILGSKKTLMVVSKSFVTILMLNVILFAIGF